MIVENLSDIRKVIDKIKKSPHTYNSILEEEKTNGTYQFLLRKKLNRAIKEGKVCKTVIPGTRFGKCIFYTIPKEYTILIETGRLCNSIYAITKFKKVDSLRIKLLDYKVLKNDEWEKGREKIIHEGGVLKWI